MVGQTKSGVKVYEKVLNGGSRRVLGSFDADGILLKKIVIDKTGGGHKTQNIRLKMEFFGKMVKRHKTLVKLYTKHLKKSLI